MSAQAAASALRHDLEAGVARLLRGGGAVAQRDRDVLDARVAQVLRVGVALAAIADDGDLLARDAGSGRRRDRNRHASIVPLERTAPATAGAVELGTRRHGTLGSCRARERRVVRVIRPRRCPARWRRCRCGRPRPGRPRAISVDELVDLVAPAGHLEHEASRWSRRRRARGRRRPGAAPRSGGRRCPRP